MPENEKCFCHLNGLAVKDATARQQIAEQKKTIEEFQQELIQELNQQIAALNQQIEVINNGLELLNDLNADISTNRNNITAIDGRLNSLEEIVDGTLDTVTNTEQDVADLIADFATHKAIHTENADGGNYRDSHRTNGWWNPAMTVGTEYKTVFKWNKLPVYTKLVNCGKMPNKSEKWVDHGCDATAVLWAAGQCGNTCFPRVGSTSFIAASIYLNTTSIGIYYGGSDRTGEDALVQIWYVKD